MARVQHRRAPDLAVIGIGLALAANSTVNDRRRLVVDRIAPAQLAATELANALINEETGVRGFIITRQAGSLAPYRQGVVPRTIASAA